MARNISANSIAKLAQTHGVEPVIILEVQWKIDGAFLRYATKNIDTKDAQGSAVRVPGNIIDFGDIDSVVAISLNETSEEFDLTLDDTDGFLKEIIDTNDIMLRDVRVHQWFEELAWEDRFLIFQGKINSPISWNESDRTVKFSVVSQLEDRDVGFSPEEGEFPDLPDDMIGKLWPECFGTTLHEPAIQVDYKHSGILAEPVGLADFTIPSRIGAINTIIAYLIFLQLYFSLAAGVAGFSGLDDLQEQLEEQAAAIAVQIQQYRDQITELSNILAEQRATERSQFRVIGGENFPRGTLKLEINDAIFTGSFLGTQGAEGANVFRVSCADHPERKNFHRFTTPCGNPSACIQCKEFPFADGAGVNLFGSNQSTFVANGNIIGEDAGAFFAQGGTTVAIFSAEPLRYFISITPGTVLKVASFATTENNQRVLIDVPTNLYRVYRQRFGSVSVAIVEVSDALSKAVTPWEDTIYVSYRSSIGPNPIDIMTYLIEKYADIGYDRDSFAHCKVLLENYPMHFCLTQKKNIVTVLKELAFMARSALSIKSGKFFCHYLPEQPTSIFTFSEDNVLTQSVELGFTETEELVTKYIANWRSHGAQDEDNKIIIRYNIKKYGTHEESVDMYAYNYSAAIIKALTFWINRRGHTWKKLHFQAALDALNVETFDGVTLDFAGNYASNGPVLGIVENGSYNIKDNTLDFEVWTGVRSGEMTQYTLAYPKDVSILEKFPDPIAEAAGFGGGAGPGTKASGLIFPRGERQGITINYEDEDPYQDEERLQQDQGSKKPSDQGDNNPGVSQTNATGNIATGTGPPATPTQATIHPTTDLVVDFIDIRTTKIFDSVTNQSSILATFFKEISASGGGNILKASTDAIWKDDTNESEFDFKFDTEGSKFGAGTAFLKDN